MVSRCNLGSYLSVTADFCTNRKNRLVTKCGNAGFMDKILKTADPIFDLTGVIAESSGASEDTLKAIGRGRAFVKTGRSVAAFFNIFQGTIPALVESMKNIYALMQGACAEIDDGKYKDYSKGEKWGVFFEQAGKATAAGAFIGAFGVCAPIASVEKYICPVDPIASNIGKAMPTVMMVNHIGGFMGHTSALVYHSYAFERRGEGFMSQEDYNKKMLENGLGCAQRGLELVADIAHHAGTALPAGARIPLNLAICVFSVAKEWVKE